jgi:hypothetical protein
MPVPLLLHRLGIFCPSCGENSAEQTFAQSLEAIRVGASSDDKLRSVMDRDDAEVAIRLLREKASMTQSWHSSVSPSADTPGCRLPRRHGEMSSSGWTTALRYGRQPGRNPADFLAQPELARLKIYFQQRHLLAHCEGIVDADYVARSGDHTYPVGQHQLISRDAVLDLVSFVEILGKGLIGIT